MQIEGEKSFFFIVPYVLNYFDFLELIIQNWAKTIIFLNYLCKRVMYESSIFNIFYCLCSRIKTVYN